MNNKKGRLAKQSSPQTFSPKNSANAAEAQRKKILALLRIAGRNTFEFRARGIAMPATRIFELKAQGFDIQSSRIVAADSDGFVHSGAAHYELVGEAE